MSAKIYLPNLISGVRVILAPVSFWFILNHFFVEALISVFLAAVTDWADGFLARKYSSSTTLGKILDPLADKLFIGSTLFALTYVKIIPFWLFYGLVVRDLAIILAVAFARIISLKLPIQPLFISKLNTFFQFILLLGGIASLEIDGPIFIIFYQSIIYGTLVLTVLSGIAYAKVFWLSFRERV